MPYSVSIWSKLSSPARNFLRTRLMWPVDGAVVHVDVLAIGGVDQLVAGFHHAGARCQGLYQQELGHGQLDVVTLPGALVLGLVQGQLAAHHQAAGRGTRAFRLAALIAAEQGADALDQQALGERLGDVVVGAEAQAHELVHLLVLGGQEDDRHVGALAQPLQQLHAVHAGHLDVEHRQVGRLGGQVPQGALAIGEGAHQEALRLQGHADGGEDVAVVIDEGDCLLHGRQPLWTATVSALIVAQNGPYREHRMAEPTMPPQPDRGQIVWQARSLLREARAATLATAEDGQPYASLVTPAPAPDLSLLMLLSGLSAHTPPSPAGRALLAAGDGRADRAQSADGAAAERDRGGGGGA